jgi:hypothetical protein
MQRTLLLLLATLVAAGAAQADDQLQRKSGLWELKRTSTVGGGQTRTYQMCIDKSSDDALNPLADGSPGDKCKTSSMQREGDKLTIDAACNLSKSVATTHAVITGSFDSAYKVESKTAFAPPLRGHADGTSVLEAKWTGACKEGQRPGDVVGPRGQKYNLNEPNKPTAEEAAAQQAGAKKKKKKKGGGGYPIPQMPPATTK